MLPLIKKYWLILTILLLASFLRLYRIGDYMEFLGDQGRDVVIVRQFLKEGNLFFIGPQTSIGNMYLGPYYYYFFVAPGLLLGLFNPVGPAIVVALLGITTVFLIYYLSRRWFNLKTAYLASFLYAISPVVIKYSNFSWNPNILPFFSLLFIWFISQKRYILASIAFVFCLNSHFLSFLLLPMALIYWLKDYLSTTSRPHLFKTTLITASLLLLSFTPQILFDIKHHGQNIQSFLTFFSNRETTVNLKAYKALPQIPQLFLQINTRLLAGKNTSFGIVVSLVFIILLIFVYIKFRHKLSPKIYLFLSWYLFGLLGLGLYKQHIYDHYFGFLFPMVFMLFGYMLSFLPRFILIFSLLLLSSYSFLENPFRWAPPRQLATTRSITSSIIKASQDLPFNFALLAKQNYDPGYRYFFYESESPLKEIKDEITTQLFVVCEPFQIDCQPINNPEWNVAAFGWAKIDSQWEINGIKIFRLIHTQT